VRCRGSRATPAGLAVGTVPGTGGHVPTDQADALAGEPGQRPGELVVPFARAPCLVARGLVEGELRLAGWAADHRGVGSTARDRHAIVARNRNYGCDVAARASAMSSRRDFTPSLRMALASWVATVEIDSPSS